jgi:pseudaminic acid synthase
MTFNLNKYFTSNKSLRPLIIAEVSANHCGKKSLFLKSIISAAKNGADLIKIQTYEADDITINKSFNIKNWNKKKIWNLYSKAQTPYSWHKDAFTLAKKLKIELFSSPFSERAVDFLQTFNVKLFKIASFEINDLKLVKKIAQTKKPIIVSTGMASLYEIKECINLIKKYHNKVALLHCVSGYPTPESEANLKRILTLKNNFKNINIGLSDHTNNINTSIASIPYNAVFIEKHFILSKKLNSLDKKFSINPIELKELSRASKIVFSSLGKGNFEMQKNEKKSLKFRRSIFSIKKIKKGEKFTTENISTYRPEVGLSAKFFFKVLGKRAKKNIAIHSPIYLNCI